MDRRASLAAVAALLLAGGCGGGDNAPVAASAPDHSPAVARARKARVPDWPMFGVNTARASHYTGKAGIHADNARKLERARISLPGTVDSSPIFLHAVKVKGRRHDVVVVTTSYGRTLALAAYTGKKLWEFVPPGSRKLEGTAQITNASPASDRRYVYAPSPTGIVYKLRLSDGHRDNARAWPVAVTKLPEREKLPSPLGIFGRYVVLTTDGYIGDAPPYQSHYVAIDRDTGRRWVFNAQCSNRHALIDPSTCPESGGAMFGRNSPVIDPKTKLAWTATGNSKFDGHTNWGDSVLGLTLRGRLRLSYTPTNQDHLGANDIDLGSTAPALLANGLLLQGGKEGKLVVLSRADPNGHAAAGPSTGGELQTLHTPSGAPMFTAPAVWGHKVFVTTGAGTAAYEVRGHQLHTLWSNVRAGTSPVIAGGLVWIYDPGGTLRAYDPDTGKTVAELPAGSGHWNSPIVAAGHVWLPEGDANKHSSSGTLSIYRLP